MGKKIEDVPKEVFETMRAVCKLEEGVSGTLMGMSKTPFSEKLHYGFIVDDVSYTVEKKHGFGRGDRYTVYVTDEKSGRTEEYGGDDAERLFDLAKNSKGKIRMDDVEGD
ncbi:MAG: hypothetical protein HZB68_05850 [Candidatus Aenigmarchaeota archaeon]|nr:hypothetical protein [Candidatus Aenigmarchaeota archaeon]